MVFGESHVFIKHSSLSSVATTAPKGWLIRFKSSKFSGNAELTKHNYKGIIWAAVDKAMSAFFLGVLQTSNKKKAMFNKKAFKHESSQQLNI